MRYLYESFDGGLMDFPLRENCDPAKPDEAFVWMLVGLPGQNGAPLIMPVGYLRKISQRLWECGARPVEEPTIKYRKPTATDPHWMTSPGSWVPVDTPDPPRDEIGEALALMTAVQKGELLAALELWASDEPIPGGPAGKQVSGLTDEQRREVLGRLRKQKAGT